jgi:DNA (cytosine-5)-methyltransferase 1
MALRAVDFFCGAGGMSYGLQQAGIKVLAGIDNSLDCKETYTSNITGAQYIQKDICKLSAPELGRILSLEKDCSDLVFAGCSPCQFWSKIRTNKKKSEKTAHLLKQFQKFIRHFRPGYVVVENVPGLYKRTNESVLPEFLSFLKRLGYAFSDGIINANHYGVPQNRMRYLLVATRRVDKADLPYAAISHDLSVKDFIGNENGFPSIPAGHRDSSPFLHTAAALSEANLRRIAITRKSGGDRTAWKDNKDLQIMAYEGRDNIFRDVYGRMYWDRPAPTITTRFNSLSNGRFGHPEENRAISLREGAVLQTFPKDYRFFGTSINGIARQIGNAVPPELARRIGQHLIQMEQSCRQGAPMRSGGQFT